MAVTVSTGPTSGRSTAVEGVRTVTRVGVTFDSDYLEGGESFDATLYQGSADIAEVRATVHAGPARGIVVQYDHANKKLIAYGNGGSSDTNITAKTYGELCHCDLSTLCVDVTIIGR